MAKDYESKEPGLRWEFLFPAAIVSLGVLVAAYWYLPTLISTAITPKATEEAPIATALPPSENKPRDYSHYGPKEEAVTAPPPAQQPPVATMMPRSGPTPEQQLQLQAAIVTTLAQMQQQSEQQMGLLQVLTQRSQQPTPTQTTPIQQPRPATSEPMQGKPERKVKQIAYLIDNTSEKKEKGEQQPDDEAARKAAARKLIDEAVVARPINPCLTLYRGDNLPGRLVDSINTDIPSNAIKIELTVPIYGKNCKENTPVLEKASTVIAKQNGKAEFGQVRIPLNIEEIHTPNGDVVEVKGLIADEDGAAGIPGKVNAHIGKLITATLINLTLQLGIKTAAGTPGPNQYYQNPIQQAAQDAGQSVARDINSYTDKVLKVPPTIEKDAKKRPVFVMVQLERNLQFNRPAVVVK